MILKYSDFDAMKPAILNGEAFNYLKSLIDSGNNRIDLDMMKSLVQTFIIVCKPHEMGDDTKIILHHITKSNTTSVIDMKVKVGRFVLKGDISFFNYEERITLLNVLTNCYIDIPKSTVPIGWYQNPASNDRYSNSEF